MRKLSDRIVFPLPPIPIVAILAIFVIEVLALKAGIDGVALCTSIGAIAGLGGYYAKHMVIRHHGQRRKRKS